MYTTCMFCTKPLGANEVVEAFPVGRRLAFDAARGRLWVVCRKCERWNLTPLEERWEAVEMCEKLFRETRIRTSTEHIGLARHAEGLELVRIGKPLRPEFAAWRYGDQFGRRRRRSVVRWSAAGVALAGGVAVGGAVGGLAGVLLGLNSVNYATVFNSFRPIAVFRTRDGRTMWMNRNALAGLRLTAVGEGRELCVDAVARHVLVKRREQFLGEDALRVLSVALPPINALGGSRGAVQSAVAEIESSGRPHRFVSELVVRRPYADHGVDVRWLPKPTRLALEMALHEEQERRALEGELWRLEQAWREAEEIAAISDNLLLPRGAAEFVDGGGEEQRTDIDGTA